MNESVVLVKIRISWFTDYVHLSLWKCIFMSCSRIQGRRYAIQFLQPTLCQTLKQLFNKQWFQ